MVRNISVNIPLHIDYLIVDVVPPANNVVNFSDAEDLLMSTDLM